MVDITETGYFVLVSVKREIDWDDLCDVCRGYLAREDMEKLRACISGICLTIIVEFEYVDKDYRENYSNFFSKKFGKYPSKTIRLLFFDKEINRVDSHDIDKYSNSFIGYSVIRPNRVRSIGRTVLDPRKCREVNGYVALTEYKVHFLGKELLVEGFPFISQDSDVTVCAHAACWMCFRYFSERYNDYPEIMPFEITQLTSDFSYGRLVPSPGLTMNQVAEMFTKYGLYPRFYTKEQYGEDFLYLLYTYIESGLPPVIGLPDHAIVAIGHTLGVNKSSLKLGTSFNYCNGIIGNDDNETPYKIVWLDKKPGESYYSMEDIDSFVVPLYEKICLYAEHAHEINKAIIEDDVIGVDTLSPIDGTRMTRTYLTSSKSFKLVRKIDEIPNGIGLLYSMMPMPKFIWVCELTTEKEYKKGNVFGEILIDSTANHRDPFPFISIHYPGVLIINDRDSMSMDPKKRFYISDLPQKSSYPCYRNNLKEV